MCSSSSFYGLPREGSVLDDRERHHQGDLADMIRSISGAATRLYSDSFSSSWTQPYHLATDNDNIVTDHQVPLTATAAAQDQNDPLFTFYHDQQQQPGACLVRPSSHLDVGYFGADPFSSTMIRDPLPREDGMMMMMNCSSNDHLYYSMSASNYTLATHNNLLPATASSTMTLMIMKSEGILEDASSESGSHLLCSSSATKDISSTIGDLGLQAEPTQQCQEPAAATSSIISMPNCNVIPRMHHISPDIVSQQASAPAPPSIDNNELPISPQNKETLLLKPAPVSSSDFAVFGGSGDIDSSSNRMLDQTRTAENICGHLTETISSPRNPAVKRRKNLTKKVVCVPAPAPANSRSSGEVVPSDLWAWRKYGQKPIKGSPYPRGYYRCSSSKGCWARKQVERSRTDPNMLVITYTSEHNHPWPTQRNALAGSTRSQPSKNKSSTPGSNTTSQLTTGAIQQQQHLIEHGHALHSKCNVEESEKQRGDEPADANKIMITSQSKDEKEVPAISDTFIKEELGDADHVGDEDDTNNQLDRNDGCDANQLGATYNHYDSNKHWCSQKIFRPTIGLHEDGNYQQTPVEQSQDDFFAELGGISGNDAFSYLDWPSLERKTTTRTLHDG
uniref:WRKY domain-containing protein n=1 Tax=Kalanchoe fedtschenkoi TaxID=63787 RepID=A0A7N0T0Y1_KALFE